MFYWTCNTPGRRARGDGILIKRFACCWDTARQGAHTSSRGSGRARKDTCAGTRLSFSRAMQQNPPECYRGTHLADIRHRLEIL